MISIEVENRIARYYFHRFLPNRVMKELESLLLPYYLEDEEPSADEMVQKAIKLIEERLED